MRLINMNWKQAEAYFQTHDMVILTTGSIECHGRHNPLGTDTLIPMKLLDLIEERSDVMILPTLPYGDCDWHLDFPGAISIGSDLLCATVERICGMQYLSTSARIFRRNRSPTASMTPPPYTTRSGLMVLIMLPVATAR